MTQLNSEQQERYERHVQLPNVGEEGQIKLLKSKVLLIGAGGLGSPVALYLAGAGIGILGVVDDDKVTLSNLQRQVLYSTTSVGNLKVKEAELEVERRNPDVSFIDYPDRLTDGRIDWVFYSGWDVVIDACDNTPTRYLVNEACVKHKVPLIHGAVFRYEGQVTTFHPHDFGPCYQCIYPLPEPPPPRGQSKLGVLGVVPGMIGMIQATEALKLILGIGRNLVGRFLVFDALDMTLQELPIMKSSKCPICSSVGGL